jgi:hypothetical protein
LSFLALFIIGVIAFTSCSNARQITKNDVVTITLQFFVNLPKDLESAAALDGLGEIETFSALFCL